jgi:hypothetical protein
MPPFALLLSKWGEVMACNRRIWPSTSTAATVILLAKELNGRYLYLFQVR